MNRDTAPSSVGAEKNLISALLCDPAAAIPAAAALDAAAFADPLCSALFATITATYRAGRPVDSAILCVSPALSDWDESIVVDFLGGLYAANRPSENVPHYVEIIGEAARRREAGNTASRLYRDAIHGNPLTDSHEIISETIDALAELRQRYGAMDLHTAHASDLIREAIAEADARALHDGPSGVASGIADLDYIIGGWLPGDLVTVGARSSMGKSTLLGNFVLNACRAGKKVLYFSTEMKKSKTMGRILCNAADIDAGRWRSGRLSDGERTRLLHCDRYSSSLGLQINDKPDASPAFVYDVAQRVRDEWGGLDLVVVDYLQRLKADTGTRQADRRIEIGQMARALKNSARKLDVPILTASQVGRQVERREDKRPMLSDLMESGDIEAESDVVLFIYRPAYYAAKEHGEGEALKDFGSEEEAEIIIAKQREGATGMIKVKFVPKHLRFCNLPPAGEGGNF